MRGTGSTILIFSFMLFTMQPAYAADTVQSADTISMSSAQKKAYEEVFEKTFADDKASKDMASFSIQDSDIISWEENTQEKYTYFALTTEKNAELEKTIQDNIGKSLQLNLGENFVLVPAINPALHQGNGLVLMTETDKRSEFMRSILSKQVPNTMVINTIPAEINVLEIPPPAAGQTLLDTSDSGTADSAPQSVLKPGQ